MVCHAFRFKARNDTLRGNLQFGGIFRGTLKTAKCAVACKQGVTGHDVNVRSHRYLPTLLLRFDATDRAIYGSCCEAQ